MQVLTPGNRRLHLLSASQNMLKKLIGALSPKNPPAERVVGIMKIREHDNDGFDISMNREPGMVGEAHYTDTVGSIQQLKREKRHKEAIELLLQSVEATERESSVGGLGWGVAPWYYEQLAIIYRKEGRLAEEVAILQRYLRQQKSPGGGSARLRLRLSKAESLMKKKENSKTG